jgi:hypothetical protein
MGFFDTTPATTTQTSSGTTTANPWATASPLLTSMAQYYGGLNPAMTSQQQQAGQNLWTSAGGLPNYLPQASKSVQGVFNAAGMLPASYQNLQTNLSGLANPANLNPYGTPGFGEALNTLNQNIMNTVKGQYAAAGREPSGAGGEAKTAALGLAQGEAPLIQDQYNRNVGNLMTANQTLANAGINTAQAIGGNMQQALAGAGLLPSLGMAPSMAQWQVANQLQQQPFANAQPGLAAAMGLGGMGGTTTANQTQTGIQKPAENQFSNLIGDISGIAGTIGSLWPKSDRRAKTDIKDIGRTHDDQKIYSFRFKGSPTHQIGMMADEVEKKTPQAVATDPAGLKHVSYNLATRKAATMGMLQDARR